MKLDIFSQRLREFATHRPSPSVLLKDIYFRKKCLMLFECKLSIQNYKQQSPLKIKQKQAAIHKDNKIDNPKIDLVCYSRT